MPDIVLSNHDVALPNAADQLLPPTEQLRFPASTSNDPFEKALGNFEKTVNQGNKVGALNIPFASALKPAMRYTDPELGYHPFDDQLEYKYADAHPWQTLGNNILQFGARTAGAFLESVATIPIIVSAAASNDFSKLYDNALTNNITDWLDTLNESLPTYRSEYEEEHPVLKYLNFLQPSAMMGAWGGAVNNLGFTAGAIAGAVVTDLAIGAVTGGVGVLPAMAAQGGKIMNAVGKAGKAVALADDAALSASRGLVLAERGLVQAERGLIQAEAKAGFQAAGRVDDLLAEGTQARQAAVNRLSRLNKISSDVRYNLGLTTSAAAEGAFEAAEVYNRGIEDLKQEFFDRYGRSAVGDELAQIEQTSKDAANVTMGGNMAILYLSNRVNWGSLFQSTERKMAQEGITGWFGGIKKVSVKGKLTDVTDDAGTTLLGKEFKYAVESIVPSTRIGKVLLNAEKAARIGSRSINESLEEGAQFTLSEGSLQYARDKYNPYVMNEAANLLKGFKYGLDKTVNTNEGWDNMVGGFIGGLLGGGVMGRIQRKTPISEQMAAQVKMLNGDNFNGVLGERLKDAIAQNSMAKRYEEQVRAKDLFAAKNTHYDMLFNWVNSGYKANAFDRRMDELDTLRALEGDGFKAKWGLEDTKENREIANKFLDNMKQQSLEIKANIEKVRRITKNPFKPADGLNYGAYEMYKDELAHNLSAFTEYKRRINGMTAELKAKFPLMDVAQAVNLTSVQGMNTVIKQTNEAITQLDTLIRESEGNQEATTLYNTKKEALQSIAQRLQAIIDTGVVQTSKDSVTGAKTQTGRTDNVQFNGEMFLEALEDLYNLYNGTSLQDSKYVQKYVESKQPNRDGVLDITAMQQNEPLLEDDTKADLLEKLQDIYKLTEANYNIGKFYTYLRKGVGATEYMKAVYETAQRAKTIIDGREQEAYAKERESYIREEEIAAIFPEEEDEELSKEEEATARTAAEKVVKKQPLTKEEEEIAEKKPNIFKKYVNAEKRTKSRLEEEGIEEVGINTAENKETQTEDDIQTPPPVNDKGEIEPFAGIKPQNLFGMFSQDLSGSKLRTNLYNLIFKNSKSAAAVVQNLFAVFTTDIAQYGTTMKPIPGTKLFRKPFEENLRILNNDEQIGILRPPTSIYLDEQATRTIFDMTEAEYAEMTGNQANTYAEFMKYANQYRDSYNAIKAKSQNGETVSTEDILTFFNVNINLGSRKASTSAASDINLRDLTHLPEGSALISLDSKGVPTIVNLNELNAKQAKEAKDFVSANKALIGTSHRYVVLMPILGEYRKAGVIIARNAETTKEEREELVSGLKQVASAALTEEEANAKLVEISKKFYITASRDKEGLYIDFRFDDQFNPYVRFFNRSQKLVEEIQLPKAVVQSLTNAEDLIKAINAAIATAEGRQTAGTPLSKMALRINVDSIKRQIPPNNEVVKLADLGNVLKLATPTNDVFINFNLEFDPIAPAASVATPAPVAPTPAAPTPAAPTPVAPMAPAPIVTVSGIERINGETVKDFINKLFVNNYFAEVDGKQLFSLTQGRWGVVVNINGVKVPFYQSTSGTDTKVTGQWYPFFGDQGNWVIKGNSDDSNVGYGFKAIQDVQNFLNANIKETDAIALSGIISTEVNQNIEDFRRLDESLIKNNEKISLNKEATANRLANLLGYTVEEGSKTKSDLELFQLASKKVFAELAALENRTATPMAPAPIATVTTVAETPAPIVTTEAVDLDAEKAKLEEARKTEIAPLEQEIAELEAELARIEQEQAEAPAVEEVVQPAEVVPEVAQPVEAAPIVTASDVEASTPEQQKTLFRIFEKAFYEGNDKRFDNISDEALSKLTADTRKYLLNLYEVLKPFNSTYQRLGKILDPQTSKEINKDDEKIKYVTSSYFGGFGRGSREIGSATNPKHTDLVFPIPTKAVLENINEVFNAKISEAQLSTLQLTDAADVTLTGTVVPEAAPVEEVVSPLTLDPAKAFVIITEQVEETVTDEEAEEVRQELGLATIEEAKAAVVEAVVEDVQQNGATIQPDRPSALSRIVSKIKKLFLSLFLVGTIFSAGAGIYAANKGYTISDAENFVERTLVKQGLTTPKEATLELVKEQVTAIAPTTDTAYKKAITKFQKLNQDNSGIWSFRNQFMNEDGFVYIPGVNNKNFRENKQTVYKGVAGVAHHMIMLGKADDLTTKTTDEALRQASQDILNNTAQTDYIPLMERLADGSVRVKYVSVAEAKTMQGQNTFSPVRLRQAKVSDLDFDKASSADGFKSSVKAVTQRSTGKGFNSLVYTTKDSYGKFSGGSAVLLFKDAKGNLIVREYSGSINGIQAEIETVKTQFGVTDNDITLGVYDAGSYTGKVGAISGEVSPSRYSGYNPMDQGGSSLMIPDTGTSGETMGGITALSLLASVAGKRRRNEPIGPDDVAAIKARIAELRTQINAINQNYEKQIADLSKPTVQQTQATPTVIEPTYVSNKEALIPVLKNLFNLTNEQAEAAAQLFDQTAQAWVNRTGQPIEEYYNQVGFGDKQAFDSLSDTGGVLNQIIGEVGASRLTGALGVMNGLGLAKLMHSRKIYSRGQIRAASFGWELMGDGKWRYEIPDVSINNAALQSKLQEFQKEYEDFITENPESQDIPIIEFTLGELLLKNSELLKAYPQLEDFTVVIYGDPDAASGFTNFADKAIGIKDRQLELMYSTLVHEMQHVVQNIEGFATGGNLEMFELENANIEEEIKVLETEREAAITNNDSNKATELQAQIKTLRQSIEGNNTPYEKYKRVAGESEARNAQYRLKLTDLQRLENTLDSTDEVDEESKIYVKNSVEEALSYTGNNDVDFLRSYLKITPRYQNGVFVGYTSANGLSGKRLVDRINQIAKEKNLSIEAYTSTMNNNVFLRKIDPMLFQAEENASVSRAIEIANSGIITNFTGRVLQEAANTDVELFKEMLKEIAEQAADPNSVRQTVEAYGQELVDIATGLNGGQILNQDAKGAFDQLTRVIYSLTNPDITTFPHELAHQWEKFLTDAERQTILDWAGQTTWTRATSEAFARGFEVYLAEGNTTDNEALNTLFNSFAKWIAEIYANIKQALGIELNEPMRSIYANMLNSEQIKPETKTIIIEAFHGTSASFDKFELEFLYTGYGENFYGEGLYFASDREGAAQYAEMMAERYILNSINESIRVNPLGIADMLSRGLIDIEFIKKYWGEEAVNNSEFTEAISENDKEKFISFFEDFEFGIVGSPQEDFNNIVDFYKKLSGKDDARAGLVYKVNFEIGSNDLFDTSNQKPEDVQYIKTFIENLDENTFNKDFTSVGTTKEETLQEIDENGNVDTVDPKLLAKILSLLGYKGIKMSGTFSETDYIIFNPDMVSIVDRETVRSLPENNTTAENKALELAEAAEQLQETIDSLPLPGEVEESDYNDMVASATSVYNDMVKTIEAKYAEQPVEEAAATTETEAAPAATPAPRKRKRKAVKITEEFIESLETLNTPEEIETEVEEAVQPAAIPMQYVSFITPTGETDYGIVTEIDGNFLTIKTADNREIFRTIAKVNNITEKQYNAGTNPNQGVLTYNGVDYKPRFSEQNTVEDAQGNLHVIESVELVPDSIVFNNVATDENGNVIKNSDGKTIITGTRDVKTSLTSAKVIYTTTTGLRLAEDGIRRRVFNSGQDQKELKDRYTKHIKSIDSLLARLSQFFGGIRYEYVELPFNAPARFYKGLVQINLNYVEKLTRNSDEILVHEFMHPFIKSLKMNNLKLYNRLVTELQTKYPEVIAEAEKSYTETDFKETDLIDEALTIHLGRTVAQAFRNVGSTGNKSILYSDTTLSRRPDGMFDVSYKGEVLGQVDSDTNFKAIQVLADKKTRELNPLSEQRKDLYVKFRTWFNNVIKLIKNQKSVITTAEFIKKANTGQKKFKFFERGNLNSSIEFEKDNNKYISVYIDPSSIKDSYDAHNIMLIANKFINSEYPNSNESFSKDDSDALQSVLDQFYFGSKQSVNKNTFTTAKLYSELTLDELATFIGGQLAVGDVITGFEFEEADLDAFDQMEAYFDLTDEQLKAMRKRISDKFDLLKETADKRIQSETLTIQKNAARRIELDSKNDLEYVLGYMEHAAVSINLAYVKYGQLLRKLKENEGVMSRKELNALNKEFAVLRQLISYYDQFSSYTQFSDELKDADGKNNVAYYAKAFATQQRMREGMQDLATRLTVEWLAPYAKLHTDLMKEQGYTDEKYEVTYDKLYKLFRYGGGRDTNFITFWLGSNVTSRDPINAIFANTLGDMLSINNIKIAEKADDFAIEYDRFLKSKGLSNGSAALHRYYKDNFMRKAKVLLVDTDPMTGVRTERITEKWALHQPYKLDEYEIDLEKEKAKYKNPISNAQALEFQEKLEAFKKANNNGKIAKYANPDYAKAAADPFFKSIENTYNESNLRYGTSQLRFGIIPQKYSVSNAEKLKRLAEIAKGENKLSNLGKAAMEGLAGGQNVDLSYNLDGSVFRNINTTLTTIKEDENISTSLEDIMPSFIVESNNYSTLRETQYNAETIMLLLEGNQKLSISPRTFAQEDFNSKIRQPFQLRELGEKLKELEALKAAGDPAFVQKDYDALKEKYEKGVQPYSLYDSVAKRFRPGGTDYNNQKLIGMIKDRYFGESTEEVKIGKVSATKAAHLLRLYTSINNMAGNYVAGLGNITVGNTQLFIEAHGGKYFTKADLAKAISSYTTNIPNYIADLQRPIKSKDTQLSIMLDAIQGEIENEFGERITGNIAQKMFRTSSLFLLTRAGEHQLQITNMKAMMFGKKVQTNKGEEINLYEAFVTDAEGRVSLRKDIKFTQEDLTKFIRDMHGVNRMLNGNYSDLHKTMLQRKWYGNLLLSYRKYLYPSIRARYSSERVDYERNTVEVGYFRYFFFDYLPTGIGNILKGKGGFPAWKDLKPHQKYALRKTTAELGMYGALTALGVGLFGSGDDENKEELTDAQKFGLLMLLRLRSDIGMYHIDLPSETLKQLKNPTASLQTVVGVFNVLKQLGSPFEVYEQDYGVHKEGDSKLRAKMYKLIPLVSKFQSDLDDKLGYYDLLNRNIGDFVEDVTPKNDSR